MEILDRDGQVVLGKGNILYIDDFQGKILILLDDRYLTEKEEGLFDNSMEGFSFFIGDEEEKEYVITDYIVSNYETNRGLADFQQLLTLDVQ